MEDGSTRLAALLRAQRESAGLTQRELASQAGVSLGALQDLEQGRTVRPRRQSLDRLAAVLGLTPAQHEELARASAGPAAAGQAAAGSGFGPAGRPGAGQREAGHPGAEPGHDGGSWPESVPAGPSAANRQDAAAAAHAGAGNGHAGNGHGGSGLRVAILGPLAAWRDGQPVPLGPVRQRAVLGLLTLHADTGLHRSAIIDALWGDSPPPTSDAMIQAQISRLRRLLGLGLPGDGTRLAWDGAGYRLSLDGIRLDLAEFGELARHARQAAAAGDTTAACELYELALGLWRGQPLEDIDALRGHPAVTGLARRRDDLVIEYAGAAADAGQYDGVVAHLTALTAREPLDERAHAQLIMTLAATGRQAAALQIYQDLAARLDTELGVRPGPELAAVHLQVLRQQVPPAASAPAAAGGGRRAADQVVPRQLPRAVPDFVGRSAELALLTAQLDRATGPGATVVISAIGGTAGVGKTALAVHWAHQVAGLFPDGQLYLNLRGFGPSAAPVTPAEAMRQLLDGLGVAPERIPADLDAQAAMYRSLLSGKRMLVIADNARDSAQLRPLLPGAPGCLVLVTSRNQLTGLIAGEGARLLNLDVLTEAESHELLSQRLEQERTAAEPTAVAELVRLCAGLPLALSVTAARAAARPGLPLATLAAELRDTSTRLDGLGTGEAVTDVRTVFSWSCQQLAEPSARMFRLLGVHGGPDITLAAAASLAGLPPDRTRPVLAELTSAHLLNEYAPGRYALHDLLRAYAAEQARIIESRDTERAALHRVLDHYLHTASAASLVMYPVRDRIPLDPPQPSVRPENPASREDAAQWFQSEQRVLLAAISQAAEAGFDRHAWQLPWAAAMYFNWHGHWHELIATQQCALAAAIRLGDLAGQAEAHRYLGHAQARLGAYDEASTHLTQVLSLFEQLGDPAAQARSHFDLGHICILQGRNRDALPRVEQALRLYRLAGHQAGLGNALNAASWLSAEAGRGNEALEYGAQALAIHRELGARVDEAAALDTMGYAQSQLGQHAEAIAWYQQAVDVYGDLGDRHDRAEVLIHLGDAHQAAGDDGAARDAWEQALALLEDLGHPDAEQLRSRLGPAPAEDGSPPAATAYCAECAPINRQPPGR